MSQHETHKTFFENVVDILRWLDVTPGAASRLSGHANNWLSNQIHRFDRTDKVGKERRSVSSALIDDVAEALGVPPRELVDPDFDAESMTPPEWWRSLRAKKT